MELPSGVWTNYTIIVLRTGKLSHCRFIMSDIRIMHECVCECPIREHRIHLVGSAANESPRRLNNLCGVEEMIERFKALNFLRSDTGCSLNIVFFHNSLQNLPHLRRVVAVKDLQSYQRNVSVQSLLLAGNFLHNQ